jgi:hypothetical protein
LAGLTGAQVGCVVSGCCTSDSVGTAPHAEVEVESWYAIRSRPNVRSYAERPIAPEDLERTWTGF